MAMYIFFAFIAVYGLLVLAHADKHPKGYKYFAFGLLVSILYASVYYVFPHTYLIVILFLTSMAILTQYFHVRAVDRGSARSMKMPVDSTKAPHWEKGSASAKMAKSRHHKASRSRKGEVSVARARPASRRQASARQSPRESPLREIQSKSSLSEMAGRRAREEARQTSRSSRPESRR